MTGHLGLTTCTGAGVFLLVALCGGGGILRAQTSPAVRILDLGQSTFQQDFDRLGREGYEVALFHPDLLVMQKSATSVPRTYLVVADVRQLPRDSTKTSYGVLPLNLEPGYRAIPHGLTLGGDAFHAAFERAQEDGDRRRTYVFIGSSEDSDPDELGLARDLGFMRGANWADLETGARELLKSRFSPVAISAQGVAAIFEEADDAADWKLLVSSRTSTMEKELAAAGADGYRIVSSSGGRDLGYAVAKSAGATPVEYRLLATTRSGTLERELNKGARQGLRLVASSLAALQGAPSLLRPRLTNEAVAIMERRPAPRPVTYRVIGARRVSTLEKELLEAASSGFHIVGGVFGFEETVVVLERETAAGR